MTAILKLNQIHFSREESFFPELKYLNIIIQRKRGLREKLWIKYKFSSSFQKELGCIENSRSVQPHQSIPETKDLANNSLYGHQLSDQLICLRNISSASGGPQIPSLF